MLMKVSMPGHFKLKSVSNLHNVLFSRSGDIHYIGGAEVLPAPLEPKKEQEVINGLGTERDQESKSLLIEHNLRLVVYIAKRFDNTGVGVEDLISIGTIGLIKGISTFRSDKGVRLATYCARCIENEILMHFRAQRKSAQDVSLSDTIETGTDGTALSFLDVVSEDEDLLEQICVREDAKRVGRAVEQCLTKQERAVIVRRYGLNGGPPQRQRQVAEACGISRSYVSRIEKRALQKLRKELEE